DSDLRRNDARLREATLCACAHAGDNRRTAGAHDRFFDPAIGLSRGQGAPDPRDRPAHGARVRRRVAVRLRRVDVVQGCGAKCANLALGIACGESRIGVDVHVWRVTNRWGYIAAPTAEQAMRALERKLPKEYWVEIN